MARVPAITTSIPAPIGGWNARDALGAMPPDDAIQLTNWFPTPSQVELRKGFTNWSTGLPAQVNTVMSYNGNGTTKLFAASNLGIYDCTAGGAVGAAVQAITNNKLIHTNFAAGGGAYLVCCNGSDSVLNYSGSVWSTPTITGVTSSSLNFVYSTKSRLWFIENNSLRVWYLPVLSVAGAASSIDFSSLCRRGGTLVSMASWTTTGGFGATDYTVFVTSEGEILIYQGYDPSTGSVWALQGIYQMGSPMGNKCFLKFGTDLLYLSKDGLTPMSQGRFFADVAKNEDLTDKIMWAISQATSAYAENFGWTLQNYPAENMLIVNIPAVPQQQYVMNTVTKAWCNFTGWNANCWELYKDGIYFGGNGVVSLAWNTYSDNGSQIVGDAVQAANYFGSKGQIKRWSMMRPMMFASGPPGVYSGINVDFDTTSPSSPLVYPSTNISLWGTFVWGTGTWGGSGSIYKNWQGVNGLGYSASPRVKAAGNGISVSWISTDFVFEKGATL